MAAEKAAAPAPEAAWNFENVVDCLNRQSAREDSWLARRFPSLRLDGERRRWLRVIISAEFAQKSPRDAATHLGLSPSEQLEFFNYRLQEASHFRTSWVMRLARNGIKREWPNKARGLPTSLSPAIRFSNLVWLEDAWLAPKPQLLETQLLETQLLETQLPETQLPETQLPETQLPETQAPETQAPETQAPETQLPETQAPKSGGVWPHDPSVDSRVQAAGVTREPWVSRPVRDYFGLALSGGGMRSATFNLGLLQALGEKGVLAHVDYLSTVSGGGYIGGFLTAWRRQADHNEAFPIRATGAGSSERERPEIRHLREFSRFLIPRVGFGQSETWLAVSVVLGGMLMSLLVTAAAVGATLHVWYFVIFALSGVAWGGVRALIFAVCTLGFHVASELRMQRLGKSGQASVVPGIIFGVLAALLALVGWAVCVNWRCDSFGVPESWSGVTALLRKPFPVDTADFIAGSPAFRVIKPDWWPCLPAVVWAGTALVLLVLRGVFQRLVRAWSGALDRAISRCLAPALVAAGWTGIWAVASGCQHWLSSNTGFLGALSAIAASLFLWLRDWLKEPIQETHGSQLVSKLLRALKPVLPQLAATVAVVLYFICVAVLVERASEGDHGVRCFAITLAVWASSLVWFDPARVGLHEFYRARIARCFIGAAQGGGQGQMQETPTVEQPEDNVTLGDLRRSGRRGPLHLVCCAANNLSGDTLGSLYRGARSAVLSPFGITLGDNSAPRDDLQFSAALTASAAAFNSQMGSLSMKLGPAVAFLMCALNLRLGLWVAHPLNPRVKTGLLPGWHFMLEALSQSRSDQTWDRSNRSGGASSLLGRQLHLSDGGHFENLGVYELVRRHCRYIVVSDASCDPSFVFEDLGNAVRRVREDFGVEIEIDVEPLRKNERGFATQHAVVGTIHFDGLDGTDKGTLIYLKPTLTGDEPADIMEHHNRNAVFPHDGTGDQFYDEAQWESYRRLGQHVASIVVGTPPAPQRRSFVDKLFLQAHQRWQVTDDASRAAFLALTQGCAELEANIRESAPLSLQLEFMPEVAVALGASTTTEGTPPDAKDAGAANQVLEDTAKIVYTIMLVAQVMEDVWLSADLETRWAHPLNEGWMNYFQRWASTPSFRTWWPILRPIYNPRFRDFVKERFEIHINEPTRDQDRRGARLNLREFTDADRTGLALRMFQDRGYAPGTGPALTYELKIETAADKYLKPVQIGYLEYFQDPKTRVVQWQPKDFFVTPALSGAGIQSRFLDAVLARFAGCELRVKLESTSRVAAMGSLASRSPASRNALVQLISFYKSRGFNYSTERDERDDNITVTWLIRPAG